MKISFETFLKLHNFEPDFRGCYEIRFAVSNIPKYHDCWMGNHPRNNALNPCSKTDERIYWFGLTKDGKEAYDFMTFDEMTTASVFEGRSLKEIWENVEILSFDGCSPEEIIPIYLERIK